MLILLLGTLTEYFRYHLPNYKIITHPKPRITPIIISNGPSGGDDIYSYPLYLLHEGDEA